MDRQLLNSQGLPMIDMVKIIDDIPSFQDACQECMKYGDVDLELDLKKVTHEEVATVPLQTWHQDGSHVRYFPKYSALWCETAEADAPITQIISTRLPAVIAEKYIDEEVVMDFKKTIDEGSFFKFKKESHARLYAMKANKTPMPLIEKDEKGYYTRWCPFIKDPDNKYEHLGMIILARDITNIQWKPNRLVIMENKATLHRRKPGTYDGDRVLWRAYIR